MWVIAGVLLGLVVLASLAGFHAGPHAHVVAGVLGVLAALWLVAMLVEGRSAPVLWALLSADVVVSAGVGALAFYSLSGRAHTAHRPVRIEGSEGLAVSDLRPDGIVSVRGERWSASSVNGPVPAGTRVQVLGVSGVRLEVWGEEPEIGPAGGAGGDTEGESTWS
jgi:membrane-bound ClpP family serine protease